MPGVRYRGRRYQVWFTNAEGKREWKIGTADKRASLKLAQDLENEARRVREGLADPHARTRNAAKGVDVSYLVGIWREYLVNNNASVAHADYRASACLKVLNLAGVVKVPDANLDVITRALAEVRKVRSSRTRNHALSAVKQFWRWLENTDRVQSLPKWFKELRALPEAADRRRVRRAMTPDELRRLFAATADAPPRYLYGPTRSRHHAVPITGADRVTIYRLAAGTGFRADEIRTLTPGMFRLDADPPTVTVLAAFSKNKRSVDQQISTDLAAYLRGWFAAGNALPRVPTRTADMIRADLALAGIPYETPEGVVDFHSVRHTYITLVVHSGVSVKTAQELARHSTPTLTIGRYAHTGKDEKSKALEGWE